jgi:hypothetical protein
MVKKLFVQKERGDDKGVMKSFFSFCKESLLLLCLLGRLLRHASQPVDTQGSKNVKDNVHPNQAKVPPSLRVVAANASQVSVGLRDRAVDTLGGRIRVEEIASSGVDKGSKVLAAGLA